jgi:hypothetical protein
MIPLSHDRSHNFLYRFLAAVLFVGATAGAQAQTPPSQAGAAGAGPEAAIVQRTGTRVAITGYVAPATVEAFKRELSAPDGATIGSLVINSAGGDVDQMIALGKLIHARKMTIQVERVCGGPCAVFLVPATERLVASRGSLLVYIPIFYAQQQMAAQAAGTPDEPKSREAFARQASYFRELGVEPDNGYAIGETALVVKAALATAGKPDQPLIVPDANYLRKCLGISSVEMPDYSIADSSALAHVSQHTPLAFLIDGKIYYEGKEVATFAPTCSAN